MESNIQEIKDRIDIVELAERLGLDVMHNRKQARCFNKNAHSHDDKTPSMSLHDNLFKCFACGVKGSVIDLYMGIVGCDVKTALHDLEGMYEIGSNQTHNHGQVYRSVASPRSEPEKHIPTLLDKEIYKSFHELLQEPTGGILDYLRGPSRGLTEETIKRFQIGFLNDVVSVFEVLSIKYNPTNLLSSGLLKIEDGCHKCMFTYYPLVIPYFNNGEIVYLKGRHLNEFKPKYMQLKGKDIPLFNVDAIVEARKAQRELYICEGEFDTMMAVQNGYMAIGIIGANGLKEEFVELFKGMRIVLAYDNDDTGQVAIAKDAEILARKGVMVRKVILPEGIKDLTEYFMQTSKK